HIPGTTRDIIEDQLRLNGLNIKVTDTAGIRESTELIEQEGIRRTHHALATADLVLFILDASKGIDAQERSLMQQLPKDKTIAVWNKCDLPHSLFSDIALPHVVRISAKTRQGLNDLHTMIDTVIWKKGPPSKEEILITNVRHKKALSMA